MSRQCKTLAGPDKLGILRHFVGGEGADLGFLRSVRVAVEPGLLLAGTTVRAWRTWELLPEDSLARNVSRRLASVAVWRRDRAPQSGLESDSRRWSSRGRCCKR